MNTLRQTTCVSIIAFGLAVAAHAQFSSMKGVDSSKPGIMNDLGLRGISTASPPPKYPTTSLARKITGVAVVAILVDRNGNLQTLTVVQAPDEAIGQSVHDALSQWKFRPIGVPMKGKLLFYFTINKGSGRVASPEEMNPAIAHDQHPATDPGDDAVKEIREDQLDLMRKRANPSILDIRDRVAYQKKHRTSAVNIPLDEVWPRASIELQVGAPVVIDCYPDQSPTLCKTAAQILGYLGFGKVSVLVR